MYSGVAKIFLRYWAAYGGGRALFRSPYLHLASVLLLMTFPTWTNREWWIDVISVLPNLLGFTLGGFAMFLGFGDERFRALLAAPDRSNPAKPSLYVSLCSTFVHFIVVQVIALAYALVAKAWDIYVPWPHEIEMLLPAMNLVGGAVGYGLFLYAVTSILAATMHVFRIATWYEKHQVAAKFGPPTEQAQP